MALLFPLQFKRQYSGPLDVDMYFDTSATMNTYLTDPLRYAGQIVACGTYEGKVFVLNNAKDEWLEVGGTAPIFGGPGRLVFTDDTSVSTTSEFITMIQDGPDETDGRFFQMVGGAYSGFLIKSNTTSASNDFGLDSSATGVYHAMSAQLSSTSASLKTFEFYVRKSDDYFNLIGRNAQITTGAPILTSAAMILNLIGTSASGYYINGSPHVHTVATISATGTPSSATYLRGDGSWTAVSGGVDLPANNVVIGNGLGISAVSNISAFGGTNPNVNITVAEGGIGGYLINNSGLSFVYDSVSNGYRTYRLDLDGSGGGMNYTKNATTDRFKIRFSGTGNCQLYTDVSDLSIQSNVSINLSATKEYLINGNPHTHTTATISATGTPSSATFFRGDNTWSAITSDNIPDLSATYVLVSSKGQANGVASLTSATLIPVAQMGSGSATTATFLRGDGTWGTPAGGGTIGGSIAANQIARGGGTNTIQGSATLTYDGTSVYQGTSATSASPYYRFYSTSNQGQGFLFNDGGAASWSALLTFYTSAFATATYRGKMVLSTIDTTQSGIMLIAGNGATSATSLIEFGYWTGSGFLPRSSLNSYTGDFLLPANAQIKTGTYNVLKMVYNAAAGGHSLMLGRVATGVTSPGDGGSSIVMGDYAYTSVEGNTTSYRNYVFGYQAGYSLTSGNAHNILMGNQTAYYLSSGCLANVFLGHNIGLSNASSSGIDILGNTVVGYNATYYIPGNYNSIYGYQAGYSLKNNGVPASSATNNTLFGYAAGYGIVGGTNNVAVGSGALYSNAITNNVAVGINAGRSTVGSGSVFLGYNAGYAETGSNKLYISNANTTSAATLIYGDFSTKILRFDASLQINTSASIGATYQTSSGIDFSPLNASYNLIRSYKASAFQKLSFYASEYSFGNGTNDWVVVTSAGLLDGYYGAKFRNDVQITSGSRLDLYGTSSFRVGLLGSSALSANYDLTLPAAIGTSGQVMALSSASGTMTWVSPGSSNIDVALFGWKYTYTSNTDFYAEMFDTGPIVWVAPYACTITHYNFAWGTPPTGNFTFYIKKNGAAGVAITGTITANTAYGQGASTSAVTLAAGDRISAYCGQGGTSPVLRVHITKS